jgi:hypothetical protein
MSTQKKVSAGIALLGLVVLAAHLSLGMAGVMTSAQWQSGAAIGVVLFVAAGIWHRVTA